MTETTTAFRTLLEEIAASRGLTLEEACELTVPAPPADRKLTVEELCAGGYYGWGDVLGAVLRFDEAERVRIATAYAEAFLGLKSGETLRQARG